MEEVNFSVVQGDTFNIQVSYTNPDGTAINLENSTARMDVRDKPGGKVLCASIDNSSGIVIDEDNGILQISFSPAQTKRFIIPSCVYQLQLTSSSGIKTTILQGHIKTYAAVVK